MSRKITKTTMLVAVGTRNFGASGACARTRVAIVVTASLSARAQDEHEQGHEGQVDEVHALDQPDDQEHGGVQPAGRLGLAGHALDDRRAGQAVTDRRADGATGEGDATADEGQALEQARVAGGGRLGQVPNAHYSPRSSTWGELGNPCASARARPR